MSGRHRGKPDDSPLIALLAVVVVPLAGITFIIYVGEKHPSAIFIPVIAVDGVILIQAAHRVVLNLANTQPRSAEQVVARLSLVAQLTFALAVTMASIGHLQGWMHGIFRDVVGGALVLWLVGAPIYWLGGKRRLIDALRTQATEEGPES